MDAVCSGFVDCLYDFQTLASGMLALAAAIVGGGYVLRSSRLPLEAQREAAEHTERRKALLLSQVLAKEFFRISEMAKQAAGTIRVIIAADKEITENSRAKTIIDIHPVVDDWEIMALLPEALIRKTLEFRRALDRHNFDMRSAGGSYGDDHFRIHVKEQVEALGRLAHGLGNAFEMHTNTMSKAAKSERASTTASRSTPSGQA